MATDPIHRIGQAEITRVVELELRTFTPAKLFRTDGSTNRTTSRPRSSRRGPWTTSASTCR